MPACFGMAGVHVLAVPGGPGKILPLHYKDIRRHGSRNCSSMSSIKITQVGSDAASRPMRRRVESAIKPK
jgi:hypothetical protein